MLLLVTIVLVVPYVYWLQNFSRLAEHMRKFPSPKPSVPIIGHVWNYSTDREIMFKQFRAQNNHFKQTYAYWGGPYLTLHVVTADDAEILLSNAKYIDKGTNYKVFHQWLGTGLLTSTGTKWHHRRKLLTPAFHYNILQMFVEVFGEQCAKFTKILKDECGKEKTDIYPLVTKLTLSTICETSMGVKMEQSNSSLLSEYYNALYSISDLYIKRSISPWIYPDFTYRMHPYYWRERKLVKYLHKFTSTIIKTREGMFQEKDVKNLKASGTKPEKRLAMLDLLLYAKHLGQIDDEGIREEVDTFVFAGHDTTSAAISFALFAIANNKDVQDKIIVELDGIFGASKRHVSYEDLQNMRYLDCCLKESLRLYPPVSYIMRRISEDVQLTHHVAPAGSEIWMFMYDIHRDPKYYPDPEKFDPDRFSPENSTGRNPFAYVPFSAGSRNCIGQKFAMLELKSVVSSVLRNFILEPVDTPQDLRFIKDIVLRVKGPIHIKFKSRNVK